MFVTLIVLGSVVMVAGILNEIAAAQDLDDRRPR